MYIKEKVISAIRVENMGNKPFSLISLIVDSGQMSEVPLFKCDLHF